MLPGFAFSVLRDTIDLINASEDYSRAEKRMMIRDLERAEQDVYDATVRTFREYKKLAPN